MNQDCIVKTRFAPSPSGHLHVGGARTALFCWAFARKNHGRFILRIEDTDQRRSSDAASLGFLRDLAWLGMAWDEGPEFDGCGGVCGGGEAGPYFQSQRLDIYNQHFQQLLDAGRAYYAFDTPDELNEKRRAAQKAKQNYRYDRRALNLTPEEVQQYLDEGRPAVIRFKRAEGDVSFHDEVFGETILDAGELDDFIIRKADGFPTYHFAVVVDDQLMRVTHVLRAQEHFKNTAKHVQLQDALGFTRPTFAHVSIIVNPDGSKMSKRDGDKVLRRTVKERGIVSPPADTVDAARFDAWLGDKDQQLDHDEANALAAALQVALPEINVDDFKKSGYLPGVLCNFLALNGWSPGGDIEKFDLDWLTEHFSLERLIKAPAKFDRDKLLAFNHDAIQELPEDEWVRLFRAHCETYRPEYVEKMSASAFDLFAHANQKRSKTLDDAIPSCRFFIAADDEIVYESSKAIRKALVKGSPNGLEHLEAARPALEAATNWTVEGVEEAVRQYAEAHTEGNLGKIAQPLRIAVTGGTVSPAIFETLVILGKQTVLNRIDRCLASASVFDNQ